MQRKMRKVELNLPLIGEPTREIEREAASAGFYETGGMKFPRIQILTAAEVLDGHRPRVPFGFTDGFKKAAREPQPATAQARLDL